MNEEKLLRDIDAIIKKHDLINQKTGACFNILEITDLATNEIAICRILCELLSPRGSHYQGYTYLRLFIEDVLQLEITEDELLTAKVYREHLIDKNRRIDMVITTSHRCIPIEVKINADDQDDQCFDYYINAINSNVYYLTRFGDSPSKESAGDLTPVSKGYLEVTNISFKEDILKWLNKCLSHQETIRIGPIREVILQLATVIRKFTNKGEDEEEMEVQKLISASSENMHSSIKIESALKSVKIAMIEKLLKAIEKKVNRNKLNNIYDYEANSGKKVKGFYNHNMSTYPGISYLYTSFEPKNVDVWLRIEINYRLYVGYCTVINGEEVRGVLSDSEISQVVGMKKAPKNSWLLYWEYLPNSDKKTAPDFKSCNNAFLNLYDEEKFLEFVELCIQRINQMLEIIPTSGPN